MNENKITFEILVESGAIEFAGIDEDGEMMYNFTNKLKDIAPELFDLHLNQLNSDIMHLWEKGFVDMDLFQENPVVKLTSKAFDKDEVKELNKTLYDVLKQIKKIYRERP